jgi:hypothetical protein
MHPMPPPKSDAGKERNRPSFWLTSPLLLAVLGLIGTAIGWLVQGYFNAKLEREKFQSALIQNALASANQEEAASKLKFLIKIRLIDLNEKDIQPAELPVFRGSALRDRQITIPQAKGVLTRLGLYKDPIDDQADLRFVIALMRFQEEKKLKIDGLIGPETVLALWKACDECPGLLQMDRPTGVQVR